MATEITNRTNADLLKANLASPTFTGTISGITATMVGLGNADNTSDTNKPVSTAQQTALDLKEDLSNKSINVTTDATSDTKYPSVKSVKTYVDASASTASTALATEITNRTNADLLKANIASPTFTGTVSGITATMVGLGNTDNTSDTNKPVSTAQQTALDLKEDFSNKSINVTTDGASDTKYPSVKSVKIYVDASASTASTALATEITNRTNADLLKANIASPTFTGTVSGIDKTMVGLGNVDDTSDADKPISSVTQTALDLKANLASPTFTGTVSGITATMVGLANVNNTSDANKPISTATQTALDLKANLASPTFTGTPTLPIGAVAVTQTAGNNSTAIATTAYVDNQVATATTVREVADEFSATASQTSFTLTQTPSANSKVKMYVNGVRISNSAYSVSGTTLTYIPANNGSNTLSVSDRIQFDYFY